MPADCPKCSLPLRSTTDHCPPLPSRSCEWIRHGCGAVIDRRHPSRWIDYPVSTKE